MKRADWLNLTQAGLIGLQYFNLQMTTSQVHIDPIINWGVGAFLASGTMFVHLMGINTPVPGQTTPPDESKPGGTK